MFGVGYVTEQAPSVTSHWGRFVEAAAPAYAIRKSVPYMSTLFSGLCKLSLCKFDHLTAPIGFHAIVGGTGRALVIDMRRLSFELVCCLRLLCTSP